MILVTYFSPTGNTKRLASRLAKVVKGDLLEIVPQQPYTQEHLDWTNKNSRTSVEVNTDDCRPAVATKPDVKPYDVIFVGFPIWWYTAPKIINTFLEQYDLTGKTVVPFATSGVLPSDRQTKNCNLPAMVQNYCPARYSVVLQAKENWKIGLKTY